MGPSNWVTLLSPTVAGGAVLQSDLSSVHRDFVPEEWPGRGFGLLCSQAVGRSYSSPARTPQMQEGQGWWCHQAPLTASSGRGAPHKLSQGSLSKGPKLLPPVLWGFPLTICPKCQSIYTTQRCDVPENSECLERT